MDEFAFSQNEMTQDAVIRNFEIIGREPVETSEPATTRASPPRIPGRFPSLSPMKIWRNALAHGLFQSRFGDRLEECRNRFAAIAREGAFSPQRADWNTKRKRRAESVTLGQGLHRMVSRASAAGVRSRSPVWWRAVKTCVVRRRSRAALANRRAPRRRRPRLPSRRRLASDARPARQVPLCPTPCSSSFRCVVGLVVPVHQDFQPGVRSGLHRVRPHWDRRGGARRRGAGDASALAAHAALVGPDGGLGA